jgi:transcriptional regulator with XRE-family HTH domain
MSAYKQKPELIPLGTRIAEKRAEAGLKQEELAAKLGIGRPALTKIELGAQDAPSQTLAALGRILGVSSDYLLNGASAANMDVFLKTGLEDRAIDKLARWKDIEDDFGTPYDDGEGNIVPAAPNKIDIINELLSDDAFYTLLSRFSMFRQEWGQILTESAEWEKKKAEAKLYSKAYREAAERIQALSERADFIKWRFTQETAKYTDKLLEVK